MLLLWKMVEHSYRLWLLIVKIFLNLCKHVSCDLLITNNIQYKP